MVKTKPAIQTIKHQFQSQFARRLNLLHPAWREREREREREMISRVCNDFLLVSWTNGGRSFPADLSHSDVDAR